MEKAVKLLEKREAWPLKAKKKSWVAIIEAVNVVSP